jgi:hypothetical protein
LVDSKGNRNAWKIAWGKRSLDHRLIWDARRRCWVKPEFSFCPSSMGKGREPCYLLTNEPIQTVDNA